MASESPPTPARSSPPPGALRAWCCAVRPFSYPASVMPVLLGAAIAYFLGYGVRGGLFVLTLAGVVCFHTAANLLNDCHDFRRGLDRTVLPVSGAVVRGWLTPAQVRRAALLLAGIGAVCGLVLSWRAGWMVLALGTAGALLVLTYTTSGFCLKYAGLGDAAIFLAFGVLPLFGAFWVQAQRFHWAPVLWSLPLVSYTVGILHANNWHDIGTDGQRRCRTFAGCLGETGSRRYYRLLLGGPLVLLLVYVVVDSLRPGPRFAPWPVLLALGVTPLVARLWRKDRQSADFNMLDARTARLQMVFGLVLVIAFLLAPLLPGH